MIAVDTNVVVRLLVGDDEQHALRARRLFGENAVLISTTVLLESEWVLRSAYDFTADAVHEAFSKLLGLPRVTLSEPLVAIKALDWARVGMDFADALHLASAAAADEFVTFDQALQTSARRIKDALPVITP
ncbi:MAG: type II toxin-antitoxin system VapC family toxin [Rhodospirillales bacterium]|nr:type II toxin-antitoxin system VapC family toxin [Rhodospirillales bacterium]